MQTYSYRLFNIVGCSPANVQEKEISEESVQFLRSLTEGYEIVSAQSYSTTHISGVQYVVRKEN